MMDCARLFMCVYGRERRRAGQALIALHCLERQAKCINTIVPGALFSLWDRYGMCSMCSLSSEREMRLGVQTQSAADNGTVSSHCVQFTASHP